jgi:hypothetical protein
MSFTAGKLRILIATTNGPVEIQLLTEEDAAIGRCVACIGGTTETADIASAYHAFVVRPTGVIEGRFGHSCYRLDVSGRIDAGSSWQLGVLAAHALLAAGRLAQEHDVADAILWATGSVRPVDLTVGGVSHVAEKLQNSLPRLKQELDAKRPVLLALPAANAADAAPEATQELRKLGAAFIAVAHAQALFDPLGMKLPEVLAKAPGVASAPAAAPDRAAPAKSRRAFVPWAAVAGVITVVAVGAVISFGDVPFNFVSPPPQQTAETASPQNATQPAKTASQTDPRVLEPKGPELVPEKIPFVTTNDRERIRDQYMAAPDYKALATTLWDSHFVSGLPNQEAADKAALEACEINKHRPSSNETSTDAQFHCELFASGTVVVTQRTSIPMPPMPWINASAQKPFVASQIPMASEDLRNTVDRHYARHQRSKALVVAPNGHYFSTSGESSPEEAMRRTLERCGFISKAACLVVAVDDTFVNAIPTLAKAVGLYRPDALFGVQPGERDDIARRLATSSGGWQAVALGVTRHAGIKVGAISEHGAVDGALENCGLYDQDCRIEVIGPFLVQPPPVPPTAHAAYPTTTPSAVPPPPPAAAIVSPSASSTPPRANAPAASPVSSNEPPPTTAPPVSPAPSASTVPPAFRPAPEVHTTNQTNYER